MDDLFCFANGFLLVQRKKVAGGAFEKGRMGDFLMECCVVQVTSIQCGAFRQASDKICH